MRLLIMVFVSLFLALPAAAKGEKPGSFEYYILSLSWSAGWCALTGDARQDPQCAAGRGLTFTLHGLWPQYTKGYPFDCPTTEPDPASSGYEAMADIMGGADLARYEWQKHGRCTGLSAAAYYDAMRKAYGTITIPPMFAQVTQKMSIPVGTVHDAFMLTNPGLTGAGVAVTCKQGRIEDVRICLSKDLTPRDCGADVVSNCTASDAELDAVR